MNKRSSLTILLVLLCASTYAQAVSKDRWWEIQHNWNGITPWVDFMQLSAKYMGPNGLPVPDMNKGTIPEHSFAEQGVAAHFSTGDHTQNVFLNGLIRAGERAALGYYFVPFEKYQMDTLTSRHIRNTRDYDGRGQAVGDVYFTGFYQLLKEKKRQPDLLLCISVRTASGDNVEAARYTDAPGYYFTLSGGKTYKFRQSWLKSMRVYALAGFYSWQTYKDNYKQDDAPMYGAGLELRTRNFIIDDNLSGYFGYIKNGDQPMVNKTSITSNYNTLLNARLLFQYGIRDYGYRSIMLSSIVTFNKIKIKMRHKVTSFK